MASWKNREYNQILFKVGIVDSNKVQEYKECFKNIIIKHKES